MLRSPQALACAQVNGYSAAFLVAAGIATPALRSRSF
jgi:hypothetical protein